jgi:hypothetical protein
MARVVFILYTVKVKLIWAERGGKVEFIWPEYRKVEFIWLGYRKVEFIWPG